MVSSLLALPSWQQWILAIVAVVAIGELVSRVVATIRSRASTTIYRFDASAPSLGAHERGGGHDHHHHDDEPPPNLVMDDPNLPPAIADSRGHPRVICPCCGYPTARDEVPGGKCILCEWTDPDPTSTIDPASTGDYAAALALAKDNLAQFGSAVSDALPPSEQRSSQRDELRRLFDTLMTSERPDADAIWSRVDELTAALMAE